MTCVSWVSSACFQTHIRGRPKIQLLGCTDSVPRSRNPWSVAARVIRSRHPFPAARRPFRPAFHPRHFGPPPVSWLKTADGGAYRSHNPGGRRRLLTRVRGGPPGFTAFRVAGQPSGAAGVSGAFDDSFFGFPLHQCRSSETTAPRSPGVCRFHRFHAYARTEGDIAHVAVPSGRGAPEHFSARVLRRSCRFADPGVNATPTDFSLFCCDPARHLRDKECQKCR